MAGLRSSSLSPALRLAVAAAASALTHPVLFLLHPTGVSWLGDAGFFVVGEGLVVVVEAAYISAFGVDRRRAAVLSLLANGLSAVVGWVLVDFVF